MTFTTLRSHNLARMIYITQAGCGLWPPEAVAHRLLPQLPLCIPGFTAVLLLPLASHLTPIPLAPSLDTSSPRYPQFVPPLLQPTLSLEALEWVQFRP